jgi:deoxycytidine triphosphate deaminase
MWGGRVSPPWNPLWQRPRWGPQRLRPEQRGWIARRACREWLLADGDAPADRHRWRYNGHPGWPVDRCSHMLLPSQVVARTSGAVAPSSEEPGHFASPPGALGRLGLLDTARGRTAIGPTGREERTGEGGAWPVPQPSATKAEVEGPTLSAEQLRLRLLTETDDRRWLRPCFPMLLRVRVLTYGSVTSFIVFVRSRTGSFDPLEQEAGAKKHVAVLGYKFVLHPSELVLAATLEYLVLPADLSAQVVSRSSYGRLGLLSATAIQVHPHIHGCLTLELVNLGTVSLVLTPGERIAQLVVSLAAPVPSPPTSKCHCPLAPSSLRSVTMTKPRSSVSGADARVIRPGSRPARSI